MGYYTRRLTMAALTVYVVSSLSFVMIQFLPGGPEDYIISQVISASEGSAIDLDRVQRLAEQYVGLRPDDPLHIQYIDYMTNLAAGNFGQSVVKGGQVDALIVEALPWTIFVMTIAISLSFILGIALGGIMAFYEESLFDFSTTTASLFANSIPYYIVALLLLLVFGYRLGFFPVSGRVDGRIPVGINAAFIVSATYHAILPAMSVVIARLGGVAIEMRSNSISALGSDYIRVARLRGLPDSRISLRYVTYNAVLPLYTGMMIAIGSVFGGSIILEMIFRYEGLGLLFFNAIAARDYPLMMGAFILTTVAVVVAILLADLTYGLIDPRITTGDAQ